MSRIAFYATIKPPDHPIASGDRLIAQNLMAALKLGGKEVALASKFIAYSKREDEVILAKKKADALVEADHIIENLAASPPQMWLTYHPYCKAPDWIGPRVSKALNIPYVTIEAAKTGQGFENGADRWASWRKEAQIGICAADHHIALKPTDSAYVEDLCGTAKNISMMAPFIDTKIPNKLPPISHPKQWRSDAPILVAAGMMRPGKKVENFRRLSEALLSLQSLHWNLVIIGDGPENKTVRQLFEAFDQNRILYRGEISHDEVLAQMKSGDLFVWPGWQEPIGMVFLEAQLMGLPVAALNSMGVPLSVKHGETGLLSDENLASDYSDNLATLISHPSLREDLAKTARNHIENHHSLPAAAARLNDILDPLLKR